MAEISNDVNIDRKYCPTSMNLADQGGRGADLNKMEKGDWFTGPDLLLEEREWAVQSKLNRSNGNLLRRYSSLKNLYQTNGCVIRSKYVLVHSESDSVGVTIHW